MFKNVFDLTFSILLLLVFSPLILAISLVIKLTSSGPVFFKQKRIGKNGKYFSIIKFRTMIVNAENIGTGLDSYDDDPRVTRVGRILRNSSLDELPQLFNILSGNMSFVGPRPPTTYHPYMYEDYPRDKKQRFKIKPGITGWAQINGRNELNWDEKIKYDLEYLEKMNFIFDIKIILLTVVKVLKSEGSYDKKQ